MKWYSVICTALVLAQVSALVSRATASDPSLLSHIRHVLRDLLRSHPTL